MKTKESLLFGVVGAALLVYIVYPFVAFFVGTRGSDLAGGLTSPEVQDALGNSLVTAPVATAVATVFGRLTAVGTVAEAVGVPLTDSLVGVTLAQTFVASPFVVVTSRAGFSSVDESLEQASRTMGHGPVATFWNVSLPSARTAVAAGVVLTFARAVGEFGATMMVAYNPRTMPTLIWVDFIARGVDGVVAPSLILIVIAMVVITAVQKLESFPTLRE